MGLLFDLCEKIDGTITEQGLDLYRARGAIAMKVGYLISLVGPDDPEDSAKVAELQRAAEEVLGVKISI